MWTCPRTRGKGKTGVQSARSPWCIRGYCQVERCAASGCNCCKPEPGAPGQSGKALYGRATFLLATIAGDVLFAACVCDAGKVANQICVDCLRRRSCQNVGMVDRGKTRRTVWTMLCGPFPEVRAGFRSRAGELLRGVHCAFVFTVAAATRGYACAPGPPQREQRRNARQAEDRQQQNGQELTQCPYSSTREAFRQS